MVLSDSSLSLVHVLKSTDSRFQNLRRFIVAGLFVTLPSSLGKVPARRMRLPSSDEEGVKTAGFDGRRDNVSIELRWFAGSAKRVLSLSRLRRQLPHQVEPKERSFPLPSSDEEGGSATCRDDGRRDNVPIELRWFAGSTKWVLSLSRLRRQLPHQVEPRTP